MNTVNQLLSQMVNTKKGEKYKISNSDTAKMDVYDFKRFVADSCRNGKITIKNTDSEEIACGKKRKCIILILKKRKNQ